MTRQGLREKDNCVACPDECADVPQTVEGQTALTTYRTVCSARWQGLELLHGAGAGPSHHVGFHHPNGLRHDGDSVPGLYPVSLFLSVFTVPLTIKSASHHTLTGAAGLPSATMRS